MIETQSLQALAQSIVLSKEALSNMVSQMAEQVIVGEIDPIQAFVQIKSLYETADQFLKNPKIVDAVQKAAIERGKGATFCGAKVSVMYTTRYDYSMCGDSEYDELTRQKADIEAKIKARQMYLKSIPGQLDVVNHETDELQTITAPLPTKSSTLKVTFAKQ